MKQDIEDQLLCAAVTGILANPTMDSTPETVGRAANRAADAVMAERARRMTGGRER